PGGCRWPRAARRHSRSRWRPPHGRNPAHGTARQRGHLVSNRSRGASGPISLVLPLLVFAVAVAVYGFGGAPPIVAPDTPDLARPTSFASAPPSLHPTSDPTSDGANSPQTTPPADNPAAIALAGLAGVADAASVAPGYVRASFGAGWRDPDRNGCDARNDILGRDLTHVVFRAGTHDCVVSEGILIDPYTGIT